MKISDNTLKVLKNFSEINSGLVLRTGNVQKTINMDKSILCEAELEDKIPIQFGIYDLPQFLGNVTSFDNPDIDFGDKSLTMTDGTVGLHYYSSAIGLITSPPDKELTMKQVDLRFTLTDSVWQRIRRLSATNGFPNISLVGKNGELRLLAHEKANDTSNSASIKIADHAGDDCSVTFKFENLKMIADDYDVEVMLNGFAKFAAKNKKIKYWIAVETK